jgi:hypothetical protein
MKRASSALVTVLVGVAVVAGVGLGVTGAQALRPGSAAPDVAGGPWINSEPLTMAALRGQVVLVEFWTYG